MADRSGTRRWLVPAAVSAVVLVLLAVVLIVQRSGAGSGYGAEAQADRERAVPQELIDAERRDPEDPLTAGPVEAPVVLIVFSDYQCSFCAQWSHDTLPVLLERAESGELRIEWRDVNVFGEDSERAARAAYAAGLQDHYWEYHEALFAGDAEDLGEEALVSLAVGLGLDEDVFRADLDDERTAEEIERNAQLGLGLGAATTPSFVLARSFYVGTQPTEVFVDAIDEALAGEG